MEGHEEEPLDFVARATRLIARFGHYQGTASTRMDASLEDLQDTGRLRLRDGNLAIPARLELLDSEDSDDEDDDDYLGQDDDEDEDEEDEAFYFDVTEVSDSEESSQSVETRAMSGGSDSGAVESPAPLDHAIAHSTAVRCLPSEGSARLGKLKRGGMVNAMTMLKGREFNVSGNGRFSRAECCHVGARFLPTDGPTIVERLNSRAYIGQFSIDGSLFVAGFQVRFPACCSF